MTRCKLAYAQYVSALLGSEIAPAPILGVALPGVMSIDGLEDVDNEAESRDMFGYSFITVPCSCE